MASTFIPGSVAVDPTTGLPSGSGFALAEFGDLMAVIEAAYAAAGASMPTGPALAAISQGSVTAANSAARGMAYIQANLTCGGDPVDL